MVLSETELQYILYHVSYLSISFTASHQLYCIIPFNKSSNEACHLRQMSFTAACNLLHHNIFRGISFTALCHLLQHMLLKHTTYWSMSLIAVCILLQHVIEKATLFNNYAVEQCQTDSDVDDSLPDFTHIIEFRLSSLSIIKSEVFFIFKGLNTCKTVGHDIINNIISNAPLSRLFNLSLSNGIFPTSWKRTNVIPIFLKKGTGIILGTTR